MSTPIVKSKQEIWDRLLLTGWHQFYKMGWVVQRYLEETGREFNWDDINNFQEVYGLERIPYNVGRKMKIPVRAIIKLESKDLDMLLWAGNDSDEAILAVISAFKFRKITEKMKSKINNKRGRNHTEHRNTVVDSRIPMRRLDKKSSWSTVK